MAKSKGLTYREAGVDIRAADTIALQIGTFAKRTYGPFVLGGVGGFAGLFHHGGAVKFGGGPGLWRSAYKDPVLVACTDGVGTKLKIAFLLDKHETVGVDLVAMSVNDLIVQGAEPLFFLDYIAMAKKIPGVIYQLIQGMVTGCQDAGCALLGGETAEMPDMYAPGEYDLAGFCVGVVERNKVIDGSKVIPGDVVVGLHSTGLHSNGYSLVRKALLDRARLDLRAKVPELDCTLGEELLRPTKIYAAAVRSVLSHYKVKGIVKALANITGSGLPGNIPRTLPKGVVARIRKGAWTVPPIFKLVQEAGGVDEAEMYDTFNMGIGMTLVCPAYNAHAICRTLKSARCKSDVIGEIVAARDPSAEPAVEMV